MGDVIIEQLEKERESLLNATEHLIRSNAELKDAIIELGDSDREFKTAIEENIVVIAKYKARTQALEDEIRQLRQGNRDPTDITASVPVSEAQDQDEGMHL